jgi:YD repeat-containing protein
MTEWDIEKRTDGIRTFPPRAPIIYYYLNDMLVLKAVMDSTAITYDEIPKAYIEKLANDQVEIYAFEKMISITATDYAYYCLANVSVKDGIMGPEDPFNNERFLSPIRFTSDRNYILDNWTLPDRFGDLENPYKYLTILECGHEEDDSNKRRGLSWIGVSISDIVKRLYDRAFEWVPGVVDTCDWRFHFADFVDEGKFEWMFADGNGYYPYLSNREQLPGGVGQLVTDTFKFIKVFPEDKEIWVESSFICDWISGLNGIRHDPFEFAISNFDNAWDFITRAAESFGYTVEFTYDEDGRVVVHHRRAQDRKVVTTPDVISIKGTVFGVKVDGVICKPKNKFGKVLPFRRTVTAGTYDNTPTNKTCDWDEAKTLEIKEPQYDDGKAVVAWDNKALNYFDIAASEVEQTGFSREYHRRGEELESITYPLFEQVNNPAERETIFGIFGNTLVCVFGGSNGHAGLEDGYKHKIFPEFVYVPAGSVAEKALMHREGSNESYSSAYPGLILFAGTSSDHGRTIDASRSQPLFDDQDYFRGCGSVEVPYKNGFVRCYSMRSALAVYELPNVYGDGEELEVEVFGLDVFEGDIRRYDGIRIGYCIRFDGGLFRITRIHRSSATNITSMTIKRLSYVEQLPDIDSEVFAEEYEGKWINNIESNISGTGRWQGGFRLYWRGGGGDLHYEQVNGIH